MEPSTIWTSGPVTDWSPFTTTMASLKPWDTLRKSLRAVHDSIDSRLTEIQNITKITTSLNEETNIMNELSTTRKSIQDDLRQASRLIDEMASLSAGDPIRSAQLLRLEAVTANYSQEFYQLTQSVEQKIERRKLLQKPAVIGNQQDLESVPAIEHQHLLREKDTITSSLDLLSNIISQGRESINSLTRQQDRFLGVSRAIQQFTSRFPALRTILTRIHRARLKQTIVLASVVACGLLFMLWYSLK